MMSFRENLQREIIARRERDLAAIRDIADPAEVAWIIADIEARKAALTESVTPQDGDSEYFDDAEE